MTFAKWHAKLTVEATKAQRLLFVTHHDELGEQRVTVVCPSNTNSDICAIFKVAGLVLEGLLEGTHLA